MELELDPSSVNAHAYYLMYFRYITYQKHLSLLRYIINSPGKSVIKEICPLKILFGFKLFCILFSKTVLEERKFVFHYKIKSISFIGTIHREGRLEYLVLDQEQSYRKKGISNKTDQWNEQNPKTTTKIQYFRIISSPSALRSP